MRRYTITARSISRWGRRAARQIGGVTRSSGAFAALTRFVITPLFLFGGVFYPVTQLPAWLRPVAYATPLYHGVALCRGLTLHTLGLASAAAHVGVLLVYVFGGLAVCLWAFRRRLLL